MEKFSRWNDTDNRLFIVLNRWCKVEIKDGIIERYIPTTIDLLDVYAEKQHEVTVENFEKYVAAGLLKRIK